MAEEKEVESKAKGKFTKVFVFVGIAVVVLLVAGAGVYFYQQYAKTQNLLKNPTVAAQAEQKKLVEKIGKLIELPVGEEPTIATVSDVNKLKSQQFFAKAKNGYKVLIYAKAKKAILYDPVTNKIIEVGPINIGQENKESAAAPSVSEPLRVILLNGTKTVGYAGSVEKDLKTKASNVTVVNKGNAKADYPKTLVVDLTGSKKAGASQLAKLLNGDVSTLPAGEVQPATGSADLLVILGK